MVAYANMKKKKLLSEIAVLLIAASSRTALFSNFSATLLPPLTSPRPPEE